MRMLTFSSRTAKEILRDPLTAAFGAGFPLVLLLLLSAIQANIPVDLFEISRLAPGIAVFGLSFMTLFSATLISRDRTSALLERLYTTPLTAADYIGGYLLPMLPLALAQSAVCYTAALFLGLKMRVEILWAVLWVLPVSLFFISLGLLCGTLFSDKQVGGICGALLTNVAAWLSGTWFDLELVGGGFKRVAYALPFVHAVELERAALAGRAADILPHLAWVLGYGVLTAVAAAAVFTHKMRRS
ncbi:ABC transporter permease [Anaerofilum sp. BX8]|uniref:ABC transporter permease n=1 Tax=Anaerofilum hominis TaxID=2763016 RepID=A0A923I688_9FIRM|nr:ABC transporter permease [Anaerofilum hominis]MBC5581056.1 ABC transporter permease [Anaerofilum hominis]